MILEQTPGQAIEQRGRWQDVDHWSSVCLACMRPWIQFIELENQNQNQTKCYRSLGRQLSVNNVFAV